MGTYTFSLNNQIKLRFLSLLFFFFSFSLNAIAQGNFATQTSKNLLLTHTIQPDVFSGNVDCGEVINTYSLYFFLKK